jgi:hypothetical protein
MYAAEVISGWLKCVESANYRMKCVQTALKINHKKVLRSRKHSI